MPQPEQREGVRRGLIETAGGKLKCPLCRSDDLRLAASITAFDGHRTYTDEVRSDTEIGGAISDNGVVAVVMLCPEKHRVELLVAHRTEGGVTVETTWDANEGPEDD